MSCLKNKRRRNEFKEGLPECIFFIHKQETHGYDKIHTLRRKRTTKKSLLHGQKENFAVRDQHGQFRAGTMSQEVSSQLRGYSERPVLRRSLVRCQNQLLIKSFNFWRVIYLGSFDLLIRIISHPSEPSVRFKFRAQSSLGPAGYHPNYKWQR